MWWTCRRLHAALAGEVLTGFELRVPRFATIDLTGETVRAAVSRGKHQLIRFTGGLTLHTHMQLDGAWQFRRAGPASTRSAPTRGSASGDHELRVVLRTARGSALGFRLPVVELVPTAEEDSVVGHLGPDLLGEDWDVGEAVRRLSAATDRSVGEALLDQRNLAGIGTFWRAEVLFLQGIHPHTRVGDVQDLARLCERAHQLLGAAKTQGQATTGDLRPDGRAWVYGRTHRPCRRCGTPIASEQLGARGSERTSYWCPTCQPSTTRLPTNTTSPS